MATFVLEIKKENLWYPVYPSERSRVQFHSIEAAERFMRWVYPRSPPDIRVAPR